MQEFIGQRTNADCVIACIRMASGFSEEEVRGSLIHKPEDHLKDTNIPKGISEPEIFFLLNALGMPYQYEVTKEHLVTSLPPEERVLRERWMSGSLYTEKELKGYLIASRFNAMLMIDTFREDGYHMVYFDGSQVWDPAAPNLKAASKNIDKVVIRSAWIFRN